MCALCACVSVKERERERVSASTIVLRLPLRAALPRELFRVLLEERDSPCQVRARVSPAGFHSTRRRQRRCRRGIGASDTACGPCLYRGASRSTTLSACQRDSLLRTRWRRRRRCDNDAHFTSLDFSPRRRRSREASEGISKQVPVRVTTACIHCSRVSRSSAGTSAHPGRHGFVCVHCALRYRF